MKNTMSCLNRNQQTAWECGLVALCPSLFTDEVEVTEGTQVEGLTRVSSLTSTLVIKNKSSCQVCKLNASICKITPKMVRAIFKGELHLNAIHFSATWHGFNGNISFTFQAIQKLYHHPLNLCCGVFYEFLGIFGRSSFSRRIGKIKRNKKYWRFNEVLKLEICS